MREFLHDLQLTLYFLPKRSWYRGKHLYQRMRRGWSDQDVWNLDAHLASVIAAGIERLREVNFGAPDPLSLDEWREVLESISHGFRVWSEAGMEGLSPEDEEAYIEAKRLFALWHQELWW